jgi:hypothetical protein
MMADSEGPQELIAAAIFRSSSSFAHPPWMRSEDPEICDLVAAPAQPNQMTKREEEGLIVGDAAPSPLRLPPPLPPERNRIEEEGEDGLDLARKIHPPTPKLHKGKQQQPATYSTIYRWPGTFPSSTPAGNADGGDSGSGRRGR